MLYHKKIIVTLCLSATVVFAAAATLQQTTEPDKPEWKNLKVLPKNISKKDLDKVMDDWRDALGVRCGFCHARDNATGKNDFASDAKEEKKAAREMMKMTEKINEKYFKGDDKDKDNKDMTAAITCYVCHHGNAHPENTAPPRGQRGPGGPGQGGPGAPGQGGPGQQQGPKPAGSNPPAPGTVPTSPVTTTPPSK